GREPCGAHLRTSSNLFCVESACVPLARGPQGREPDTPEKKRPTYRRGTFMRASTLPAAACGGELAKARPASGEVTMIPNPVLREERADLSGIEKAPTGITGLDEITYGGLPKGRPTLLCGAAGCGKTLFAMTFLHHGAVEYQEPGVFVAFEERPSDLIANVGSLHYDVQKLIADKKLAIDHVQVDRNSIQESGDYDL